jgi:hypothetical protein
MTKEEQKTIIVIGATGKCSISEWNEPPCSNEDPGKQGGSVARSLLQNPAFRVRCITRDPTSKETQALRELGAEWVQGDGLDETGMEALLMGAWGIFINNGYILSVSCACAYFLLYNFLMTDGCK